MGWQVLLGLHTFPNTFILIYTCIICKRKTLMVLVDYGADFIMCHFIYLTLRLILVC